ncbi:MAG: alpha/beta fold hydrolase [Candidatus Acidiferrales bacterium]
MGSAPSRNPDSRGPRTKCLIAAAVFLLAALALFYLRYDLRAYSVLMHLSDSQTSGALLRWETRSSTCMDLTIPTAGGPIAAQLYFPEGVAHPPGIVLIHGIHHLGIHDPRFQNLARSFSGAGFAVLAPVIDALADYHVDGESLETIGESARWLENRIGSGPVTLMGISFGGGLALMVAAEPQYASSVRAVVAIGAYEDLARVSRYLATSEEIFPDGKMVHEPAHDYGAAVFVYAHLQQFFSPADIPTAHNALRYFLWEQPALAQPLLPQLSAEGRATMEALLARRIDELRPQLLDAINADEKELAAVSPHAHIASLRAPVFLLHGSADNVIPPAESLWLAREVPREDLRAVLITPVFSHVDLKGAASKWDEMRLVHFIGSVLRAAN